MLATFGGQAAAASAFTGGGIENGQPGRQALGALLRPCACQRLILSSLFSLPSAKQLTVVSLLFVLFWAHLVSQPAS